MLWPLAVAPARAQDSPARLDERMRAEVERRFAERVQQELQLTNDQAARLRATAKAQGGIRHDLRDREREIRKALADQLRPGLAANGDSVARLTDDLVDLRVRYMETYRRENEELRTFLTPVQRARLIIMRERLVRAARAAREGRPGIRSGGRDRSVRPQPPLRDQPPPAEP